MKKHYFLVVIVTTSIINAGQTKLDYTIRELEILATAECRELAKASRIPMNYEEKIEQLIQTHTNIATPLNISLELVNLEKQEHPIKEKLGKALAIEALLKLKKDKRDKILITATARLTTLTKASTETKSASLPKCLQPKPASVVCEKTTTKTKKKVRFALT